MPTKDTLFTMSKAETKAESVTRIAFETIRAQTEERARKTQKLRAARLEKEAADRAQPAPPPTKKAEASPRRKTARK